jgi:phage terminase large subunit
LGPNEPENPKKKLRNPGGVSVEKREIGRFGKRKKMNQKSYEVNERTAQICQESIAFLEALCELWPIKLQMLKAEQAGEWDEVDLIKPEMIPIIERAKTHLTIMLRWRLLARELYETNAEVRAKEDNLCSNDFVRFINTYCYTSDPRLPPLGLPGIIPFVLWPKQEEFLLWVHDAYTVGRSWLAEKSRGWGITWLLAAYDSWHWVWHDGFVGGFGSRDKDAVDKLGDPDTIFAKVRFILYNLPNAMLPEAYRDKTIANQSAYDNLLRITNPERESTIRGEGGDNIGAGGRASIYVVDESALVQHPEQIEDALSYTTNCRGDVSTVRGMNFFGEKRHSGRVRVFTCWFYQDPSKYANWRDNRMPSREQCPFLDHEYLDKGDLIVAQELLIDYSRSVENSVIPTDWIRAAVDFDLPADGIRQSGFDVASGGACESAYAMRAGPVLRECTELTYDTPQEALECALSNAEADKSELFAYDQDGIGESVWGHIKFTERRLKFDLFGIHGNSPASDKFLFSENQRAKDKFRNKRAENWWGVRERFRKTYEHRKGIKIYDYNELISIPNNIKLITQLAQPKLTPGRKIGVESKDDMRRRKVKSPDLADAVINAYADPDRESLVISEFNYREDGENINNFEIDPESPIGQQYVALVTTEEQKTYAIGCWWLSNFDSPCLRVFWEFLEPMAAIHELVTNIKAVMVEEIKPIREWVCNEEMISSLEDNKDSLWYLYRKEKVFLRKNYMLDYNTAIIIVNQMFRNGIIQVHERCERLLMQLANWRIINGKPQPNLGFVMALCQLVTRLRVRKEIKIEHIKPLFAPKHPYNGAPGRFGNKSKEVEEEIPFPAYYKLAEKQVRQYAETIQSKVESIL